MNFNVFLLELKSITQVYYPTLGIKVSEKSVPMAKVHHFWLQIQWRSSFRDVVEVIIILITKKILSSTRHRIPYRRVLRQCLHCLHFKVVHHVTERVIYGWWWWECTLVASGQAPSLHLQKNTAYYSSHNPLKMLFIVAYYWIITKLFYNVELFHFEVALSHSKILLLV